MTAQIDTRPSGQRSRLLKAGGVLVVLLTCVIVVWVLVARTTSDKEPSPAAPDSGVVSPAVAREALGDGGRPIDVRTSEEFAKGHLEGAQNINVEASDFKERVSALDPKASYVVYCASGRRAALAVDRMESAGFTDVVNAGGYDALIKAGLPAS